MLADVIDEVSSQLIAGVEEAMSEFDVATLVTALGVLKKSLRTLINERQLPVTPRDLIIIGDWFAAVAESALLAENRRFADMLDAGLPDAQPVQLGR